MNLNKLEKMIIIQFLTRKDVSIQDENAFFSDLSIENREFTGVGFITELNQSEKLKIDVNGESYKWGDLGAKLNFSVDTGYLIYVENGYISAIEGYTYAEDWPENIEQIEIYTI
jgi:hypothetical protein